jgi:septal ring factor EnvC (AmiA/AmiB activator)
VGSAGTPVALPLGPFRGALAWPASGKVSGRFGRDQRAGIAIVRNGVEIAASEGMPVRAIHDGRVAYADTFTGFGTLVIVEHGEEAYSLYGYLASASVQKGAAIEAGTVVGTVGRSPSGGPMLYFELRIDGKPVDPVQWLRRTQ